MNLTETKKIHLKKIMKYFNSKYGIVIKYKEQGNSINIDVISSINMDQNDIIFSYCHNLQYQFFYHNIQNPSFKIMLGKMFVPEESILSELRDEEKKVEYILIPNIISEDQNIYFYLFNPKIPNIVDHDYIKPLLDKFKNFI